NPRVLDPDIGAVWFPTHPVDHRRPADHQIVHSAPPSGRRCPADTVDDLKRWRGTWPSSRNLANCANDSLGSLTRQKMAGDGYGVGFIGAGEMTGLPPFAIRRGHAVAFAVHRDRRHRDRRLARQLRLHLVKRRVARRRSIAMAI